MLITESEKARVLRQVILDIANDAINQRDEDYIVSYFKEEDYRRQFDVIIAASVEPPSKSVPF